MNWDRLWYQQNSSVEAEEDLVTYVVSDGWVIGTTLDIGFKFMNELQKLLDHLPERSFARRTCVYIYIIFTQIGNNRYITQKISCINFK